MSIKKDVYIPVLQGKTRTINSEGKNELSDATNEVLDEIYFRVIDDNRKVNVSTTVLLIREIKKWLKSYREKIIPNILEPTNPLLEKEKNKIYRDTITWVEKWEGWKDALIPENRGVIGGIDLKVDHFHFVKLNDKLLEPNKLLTYNQALFLLLGLNAIALDNELRDFPEYTTFTGTRPTGEYTQFDCIFWDTPQNQALRTSAFVVDGEITSENLIKLAEAKENSFFTKSKPTNEKPTNEKTANKEKRKEIVKTVLVDFLGQGSFKHKYTINSLTHKAGFIKALKEHKPNNLIISVTGEDANKKTRKSNEITPRQLGVYLTEIFKCKDGDNWWTEQDRSIQDKVKLPKK